MPMRFPGAPASRSRAAVVAGLAASLVLLAACQDKNNTTNINGLDCGLVQADLVGTWTVTFDAGSATLTACTGAAAGGNVVTVTTTPLVYPNIVVTANTTASIPLSGVGYQVVGSGPNRGDELIANVEADSCLAQFQVWINASKTYVQCIGGFDPVQRVIAGSCDSAEYPSSQVVTDPPDTFCSLTVLLRASATVQ
jgi:hypothetical protein